MKKSAIQFPLMTLAVTWTTAAEAPLGAVRRRCFLLGSHGSTSTELADLLTEFTGSSRHVKALHFGKFRRSKHYGDGALVMLER